MGRIAGRHLLCGSHRRRGVRGGVLDSLGVADGVHNFVHMEWQLFPNPTQGVLQVQLGVAQPCQLAIFDLSGREVMTWALTQTATTVDVSALQAGCYRVQLESNGIIHSRNLQVSR